MNGFFILMLRLALVAAFLAGLFGQTLVVPGSYAPEFHRYFGPEAVPVLVAVTITGIACVQVVLVAGWMLLGMVDRDAIFGGRAFRWVDVIIGAAVAATVLATGLAIYFAVGVFPNGSAAWMFSAMSSMAACAGAGASFAMLMVIMRGLLRKATELQREMAEVV